MRVWMRAATLRSRASPERRVLPEHAGALEERQEPCGEVVEVQRARYTPLSRSKLPRGRGSGPAGLTSSSRSRADSSKVNTSIARALILSNLIEEREDFTIERRHKVAAVAIGATTGFVIGITSAGSGTVIAILLIAVYRLVPRKVVGTDVFHAAILLWAAGIAHWVGGNVDFMLAMVLLLLVAAYC